MAQAVTAAAAMNVGLMFFMDVSLFPLRPAMEICEYSMAEMGFDIGNIGAARAKV